MSTTALQPEAGLTRAEYLARGLISETRHEFYQRRMYALAGGSASHRYLKLNIGASLLPQLRQRNCRLFDSDMRVLIESEGADVYPDLSVTCAQRQFESEAATSLLNPQVVIEVLSPTTERYDRRAKFALYREIPGLNRYLLVDQQEPRIEVFTRQADGVWSIAAVRGMEAELALPEIHCTLKLSDVYAGFDFSTADRAGTHNESAPERRPGDA